MHIESQENTNNFINHTTQSWNKYWLKVWLYNQNHRLKIKNKIYRLNKNTITTKEITHEIYISFYLNNVPT